MATRNYIACNRGTVYCDLMRQEVTLFSQHEQSNLENFPEFDRSMPIGYNFCNFVDRIERGEYIRGIAFTLVSVFATDAARKSGQGGWSSDDGPSVKEENEKLDTVAVIFARGGSRGIPEKT